jgi:hypothetical protein
VESDGQFAKFLKFVVARFAKMLHS